MYLCLQYVCAGANLRDTGVFWHYTCVNFDTVLKLFFYSSAYDWVSSICVPLSNGNKLYNLTIVCSAFMTKAVRCSGSHAVCFVRNVGKLAACCGFLFTFFPGALKKKNQPQINGLACIFYAEVATLCVVHGSEVHAAAPGAMCWVPSSRTPVWDLSHQTSVQLGGEDRATRSSQSCFLQVRDAFVVLGRLVVSCCVLVAFSAPGQANKSCECS